MKEYGVINVEELKKCIANPVSVNFSMPMYPKIGGITQETLASLGVTTSGELDMALQHENIFEQFSHEPTPSPKMFQYAQGIIERAKDNILKFLQNHSGYDCSDFEELAPTIFGGVIKNGQPITIVIRPSDNKQVIIYSDSEKAYLEHENAELWIEDGKKSPPIHLTLGKVLKSTGITKIPV